MFFKICLISLIFISLTPQNNYAEVLKMLKIFGKVLDSDLSEAKIDENCTQTCFSDSDCILAFFNENSKCLLYFYNSTEFLEVQETNRDDGFFVAFKTNLSTTNLGYCPDESEISPIIFLGEDPISWANTSDSTWQFKKCVGNWQMFKRTDPEITVCMQVFLTGMMTTRKEAQDYCTSRGWKMTGVGMIEESQWILKQTQEKFGKKLSIWEGVWIDGERKTPNMNNFTWTDGYTVGYGAFVDKWAKLTQEYSNQAQDCLAVSPTDAKGIINDVTCEMKSNYMLGVACGYQLE
ncbi:hypothetical protein B9Z55_027121 [Caenorhabditis nigoni]|uniref:C-type lectin domain-containing protein n=1 Tax=Caenorhabditis nigoni TaxID=1611254 RepID=A0A2G5SIY2_9PELO|nr:hypothetical protein B9Z55_027121 [Caenorhabditis nigoni]